MKKRLIIFITGFLLVLLNNPCLAITQKKVAVLPVDIPSSASSYSIYPNTLSMVSGDIGNFLNRDYNIEVIDINKAESLIISVGLYQEYKDLIRLFKDRYVMDYEKLARIGSAIGVKDFIFISGGFDTRQMIMKTSWAARLNLPWASPIKPSYRLDIIVTVIDASSSHTLFEDSFQKDFEMDKFDIPSQYFGENSVPIKELKRFSLGIAPTIAHEADARIKSGNSKNYYPINSSKEGKMTTDGLFNSDHVINHRKNHYKQWIMNKF